MQAVRKITIQVSSGFPNTHITAKSKIGSLFPDVPNKIDNFQTCSRPSLSYPDIDLRDPQTQNKLEEIEQNLYAKLGYGGNFEQAQQQIKIAQTKFGTLNRKMYVSLH